jgi:two-component system sensor histidine kinase PfeS
VKQRVFWRLILGVMTGIVALFYLIHYLSIRTEEEMSLLDQVYRDELTGWGKKAEELYQENNTLKLTDWLQALETRENTRAVIVQHNIQVIAGDGIKKEDYLGYNFGRNIEWKVHLYFKRNPIIELPFSSEHMSLLIILPDRMRPGIYLSSMHLLLQIIFPLSLLFLLAWYMYRHIMQPLSQLKNATKEFSKGDFSVRLGKAQHARNDEFTELANTFDQMANRISDLITGQRQLIADMSHELRTPLTRLDMVLEGADSTGVNNNSVQRIKAESENIRRLVDDSLTLSWLENERPVLTQETLDLVDLLDVIVDDAKFEFPDKRISIELPHAAQLQYSNHRAVGQALENIVRNALRYSPAGGVIDIDFIVLDKEYCIVIKDHGPGVPKDLLDAIFNPFFRVDEARVADSNSFGLGLSLSRRQLGAVGGRVSASNRSPTGLCMTVLLPKANSSM